MINNSLNKVIGLCLLMTVTLNSAHAIQLQKGQLVNELNKPALQANDVIYQSIVTALNTSAVTSQTSINGFVSIGADNGVQYALLADKTLHKITSPSNQYIGGWPLGRWPHQYASPEVVSRFQALSTVYPIPFDFEGVGEGVGCYGNSPVRFGDIENDAKKELVIILNNLFMVYSLEEKRLIFSEYLDASDWFNAAEKLAHYGSDIATDSQYVSRFMAQNNTQAPGVRAYAKLYFGDFNNDGFSDILAWRKNYQSNASNNALSGFTKQSESWQHFSTVPTSNNQGEYLPQSTDVSMIKNWLSANQLTWTKGYPSQTECVGQQGLIPEMHDALLNDPDVML